MRKSAWISVIAVAAAVSVGVWLAATRLSVPSDDALVAAVAILERADEQYVASDDVIAAIRLVGRRKDGPTFADMRLVAGQAFLTPPESRPARAAIEALEGHPYSGSVGAIMLWSDCTSAPAREPRAKAGRDRVETWLVKTAGEHKKDVKDAYFTFIAREERAARRYPVEQVLYARIFVR